MAVNDPTVSQNAAAPQQALPLLDVNQLINMVKPAVVAETTQAAKDLHQESLTIMSGLNSRVNELEDAAQATVTAAIPQASAIVLATAKGVEATAAHDVWIPRVIVGGCAAAALAILIGYEAGSHQAADIVAYIAPLLVVIFGLASRMLVAFFTGNAKPPAV